MKRITLNKNSTYETVNIIVSLKNADYDSSSSPRNFGPGPGPGPVLYICTGVSTVEVHHVKIT